MSKPSKSFLDVSVTLCTYINRYNISLIIYRIENRRYDPDTDTIYIELYGNYMIGGLVSAGGAILLAHSAILIHGIRKVINSQYYPLN